MTYMKPIDSLPDLPELESVQPKDFVGWIAVAIYTPFILLPFPGFIWAYISFREVFPPFAVAALAICTLLVTGIVVKLLCSFLTCKTDTNGLSLRGPIRSAYIPWIDIKEALLKKTLTGSPLLILRTINHTYKIDPTSTGSSNFGYCMIASTWQHLRRLGRAGCIELPGKSLSLWQEICDDIPHEIEWGKRPGLVPKLGNIVGISFFPAMVAWAWFSFGFRWPANMMPLMLTLPCLALLKLLAPSILRSARQIRLNEECLEAQLLFARATIFWSRVTSAFWMGHELIIRTESPRQEIRICHVLGKKETEQLILAIIRRLRTAGVPQAVPIPDLVSTDPDALQKPAYTSQGRGQLKWAFINGLEEPVKSQIKKLYYLTFIFTFIGIIFGAAVAMLDISARFARLIFGQAPDTVFFIPFSSLPLGVPLIMLNILIFGISAEFLAGKFSGQYRSTWAEFAKIGRNKSDTAVGWIAVTIAIAGILAIPGFMTRYVRVTDSGVATRGFFASREVFHPWSDVRSVQYITHSYVSGGRMQSSTAYVVHFADGMEWKCGQGEMWSCPLEIEKSAVTFIVAKSGKSFQYGGLD